MWKKGKKTHASIEVVPPGPTPTLEHDIARNWSVGGDIKSDECDECLDTCGILKIRTDNMVRSLYEVLSPARVFSGRVTSLEPLFPFSSSRAHGTGRILTHRERHAERQSYLERAR